MKNIQYTMPKDRIQMVAEPAALYMSSIKPNTFSITRFESLSRQLPFTQQEWADMLHISDRTLQRYLKDHKPFEGLHAEHLHQIAALADMGLKVFGNGEALEAWLRRPKKIMGREVGFDALRSFGGTQLLSDELGRIAHGVYI